MAQNKFIFGFFLFLSFNFIAQITPTYNDILIPMRDGKFLSADVFIPSGTVHGQVILVQTPYNKNLFSVGLPLGIGQNVDDQAYIWVIVDWRGFYGSAAATIASPTRGEDGYDVCEWISEQSWFLDRIGTWGPSALGEIQYETAREQHPNHVCAVPLVSDPQQAYTSYYTGGVLEKARLQQLDALGYGLSPVVLTYPYYGIEWQYSENQTWYPQDIKIPTLQIGGWYDHTIDKMLDWYEACRTNSALAVRDKQWLLVGPWVHGGFGIATPGSSAQGELYYLNAEHKSDTAALKFFDFYLRDIANGWESTSKITYYETGKNVWNTSNANRVEVTMFDDLFLTSGHQLLGASDGGSSSIISDPSNPSPTIGGATLSQSLDQGPYNQISLEGRSDIVTFTSDDLFNDVNIVGNVKLNLFVECNQPDADISVRLVDVYPDGRNMLITDGIKRMRFRNGYTQTNEAFMTPGTVYPVQVDLAVTDYTWLAGHKIKAYIGGNSSIRWDVNLQNGGQMYVSGDTNVATITVHHSPMYPSKISLPGMNPTLSIVNKTSIDFGLYPNPVNNLLTIAIDEEIIDVQIVDLSGRLISANLDHSKTIIISHLATGIYTLKISTSKGIGVKRFVKN